MPSEVVYISRVRLERVSRSLRRAYLPAQEEPVLFGLHSKVAEHYGVAAGSYEPHATTIDYLVAATAG